MSLYVRPGYVNPLTTTTSFKQGHHSFLGKNSPADKAADLQTKQQQLQNTLLLMKSTSADGGSFSAEQQKKLQAELEKVSQDLQAVKNDVPQAKMTSTTQKAQESASAFPSGRLGIDVYEGRTKEKSSLGIYQVRRVENSGYQISLIP